eukprot:TRINITY_DN7024_c0_g1_i1.p1 TRINITY_DN7024_c0_g1~~TRINITY_DN7024_c0_g1_i1.p1  ORF type:complete len:329 (-),score=88.45 TRINITY_DN7024_c0_g1_i1:270-1175(-)
MAPKKAVASQANSKDRSRSRGAANEPIKACPKPKAEAKAKAKAKAAAAKAVVGGMMAAQSCSEDKHSALNPRAVASENQDLLLLREALAASRAQLEAAQARADTLERRVETSDQRVSAAEKRAAHAEGRVEELSRQAEELRQRASKSDEAELRAARAEARMETLQEMREEMPATVRSMVEAFIMASGRRPGRGGTSTSGRSLGSAKVKLEIDDAVMSHTPGGVLPLADVDTPSGRDEGPTAASPADEGQLLEFYKVANTPGSDISSPGPPSSGMRRLGGIASVLQAATNLGRSGSRRSFAA